MTKKGKRSRTRTKSSKRAALILSVAAVLLVAAAALAAVGNSSGWLGQGAERSGATDVTLLAATPSPVPVTPPPCVAPQDWVSYTIEEGDTLYSLAEENGTDVETLERVNCLGTDLIMAGKELYIPPPLVARLPASEELGTASNPQGDLDFVNILLLGSDRRQGAATWRTDTIILVSVDTERNIVRLLSIPRDLWVNIPGHGMDRLNTADLWGEMAQAGGGPDLVKRTINEALGIPIQYYVRVDFSGFEKIIDAVGGVDVDVECPLPDIELLPGMHHMNGAEALLYVRSRITTNDFDRSRRQRKVLMALWFKGRSMDILPRLPALWKAMAGTFQTDMPLGQVIGLARVGLQLKTNRIFSQSIGPWQTESWISPGGADVLVPLNDKIEELLTSFYGPVDNDYLQKINETRIEVLNGSQRSQAEQLAASALVWGGFQVTARGPAASQDLAQTQVIVYNSTPEVAELAAQQLDLLPGAIQYQTDPAKANSVDIQVVLGADYDPCATQ